MSVLSSRAVPAQAIIGVERLSARPKDQILIHGDVGSADAGERLLPDDAGVVNVVVCANTDLSPLKKRRCVVAPMADTALAAELPARLIEAGAERIIVVSPPNEGWTLAVAETLGWDAARVVATMREHRRPIEAPAAHDTSPAASPALPTPTPTAPVAAVDLRVAKAIEMLAPDAMTAEERVALAADGAEDGQVIVLPDASPDRQMLEPAGGDATPAGGDATNSPVRTPDPAWRSKLLVNGEGGARPILANAIHLFRNHPEIRDIFGFDLFAHRIVFLKAPPWNPRAAVHGSVDLELSDTDVLLATEWVQRHGRIFVKDSIVRQSIEAVARDFSFHPVRDYLNSVVWDGKNRIERWIINHAGAADTEIIRQMSSKFLIGAVARIFQPGCKLDTILVLEGRQGLMKSSALRALAEPWFTDHLPDLSSKDSMIQLHGKWIIELAELSALGRTDVSKIKSFLSSQIDRFRPPHGKYSQDFPRQSVFAGTVNPESGYLRDATGGRRFWSVECTREFDIDALRRQRDQIWAEATARYRERAPWWLDAGMEVHAADAADDRYQGDARDDIVAEYVRNRTDVSVSDILDQALGIHDQARWDQALQNVAARALVRLGWVRRRGPRPPGGGPRPWRYWAPGQLVPVNGVTGSILGPPEIPL
jgi:hypothetical protein